MKKKVCWAGWVSAPGDTCVGTCGHAHRSGRGGLLNLLLLVSADEQTWQCSIPVMQNENSFDSRGIRLISPLFTSDWDHIKTHSAVWDFHVFIKWRRCLLLWLRTQLWLSTKIPYVGIYASILCKVWEVFLFYFSSFPIGVETLYFSYLQILSTRG